MALCVSLLVSPFGRADSQKCDQILDVMYPPSINVTNYQRKQDGFADALGRQIQWRTRFRVGKDWTDPYEQLLRHKADVVLLTPVLAAQVLKAKKGVLLAHAANSDLGLFALESTPMHSLSSVTGRRLVTLAGSSSELLAYSLLQQQIPGFRRVVKLHQVNSTQEMLMRIANGKSDFGVLATYAMDYLSPAFAPRFRQPLKIGLLPGLALMGGGCLDLELLQRMQAYALDQSPGDELVAFLSGNSLGRFEAPNKLYLELLEDLLLLKNQNDSAEN